MKRRYLQAWMIVTAAGWCLAGGATAADKVDTNRWVSGLTMGLNMSRGNSETLLSSGALTTERKGLENEFRFGVEGNYGETKVKKDDGREETETNVQNARGYGDYKRLLDDRLYAYINTELSHDEIADIRYRFIIGPGLGYYLLRDDVQSLGVEAGMAFIKDKVGETTDDRFAARAAERYERKIGETSKIWEAAEYLPTVDDVDNYLINAEAGAEAMMNARLGLRIVLQDKYNNRPAPGKDANDLSLIGAVTVRL